MNYAKTLSKAVGRKWPTPEEKEWWWTKFTVARRRRTARLSEAQNHRCAFCGTETYLSINDFRLGMNKHRHLATLEHIIPQCEGGTDHISNCVMACHECNNSRGDMNAWKFYELRNDPVKWLAFVKRKSKRAKAHARASSTELSEGSLTMAYRLALYSVIFPEFKILFDKGFADVQKVMEANKDTYEKHQRKYELRMERIQVAEEAVGNRK